MPQLAEQATITRLPGDDEVLVTVGEREFVVAAACPHRRGRLLYAHVNPRTMRITCPLHRSTYDLVTGCQVSGPAAHELAVRERTAVPSC